ncbi:MAG TPA: family 43 glycosylhydrolase [Verrucomicrobiae bacterium]|nr:family 43 glycosylhydrolase [Verrucomicrobiae bacterium]
MVTAKSRGRKPKYTCLWVLLPLIAHCILLLNRTLLRGRGSADDNYDAKRFQEEVRVPRQNAFAVGSIFSQRSSTLMRSPYRRMRIISSTPLKTVFLRIVLGAVICLGAGVGRMEAQDTNETAGGWVKYSGNPVLGGDYGTCFDVSVLRDDVSALLKGGGDVYRMWFSWRPRASIALVESKDGFHWSEPVIALGPNRASGWEDDVNRPVVIKQGGIYRMWYTGQVNAGKEEGLSRIGYATSSDGLTWKRMSNKPVLSADCPWEKTAVMCPDVIWDKEAQLYKMWYSAGGQREPNAIGYATSPDGMVWTKCKDNPIFKADSAIEWERNRVTGCQILKEDGWYLMFYIGFSDPYHAQIGIARSKDGVTNWQENPENPIIPTSVQPRWDADACYKPYAIFDGKKWFLWYNGRRSQFEQIGVAIHEDRDLGF